MRGEGRIDRGQYYEFVRRELCEIVMFDSMWTGSYLKSLYSWLLSIASFHRKYIDQLGFL